MSEVSRGINWRMSDKNPKWVALISAVVLAIVIAIAVSINSLPGVNPTHSYSAYLTNASGINSGAAVQIRGIPVGKVTGISLAGNKVEVDFQVDSGVHLGSLTKAAVKVLNPLGTEYLGLSPAGPGTLTEPIPLSRTDVALTILGDLGQVSTEVQQLNLKQLQKALDVTTTNLSATSQQAISKALTGLAEFSATLGNKAQDIKKIVTQGNSIASILNDRRDELVNLVGQGETVLKMLSTRQTQIKQLLHGTAALSGEVSSILKINEKELNPMLRDLQHIADVLGKEDDNISAALPELAALSAHIAAVTGNGPWVDVVVPTGLLPDSVIQQCTSSAFPAPKNPVVGCRP